MQNLLDALWHLHQHPDTDPAPLFEYPTPDPDAGQRLQLQLLERWLNEGEELAGWKIGMTSGASRDALGPGLRPFGFILKTRCFASGARLPRSALFTGGVENELFITLAQGLGQDASRESARAAVATLAPGFEINQKRLPADASAGLRIADNLSNWGVVGGEGIAPDTLDGELAELEVTLGCATEDGDQILDTVASAGHMDDHYASLATLARRLHDFGQALTPGQHVITGAYAKEPFRPGQFFGDFSLGLGRAELTLDDG